MDEPVILNAENKLPATILIIRNLTVFKLTLILWQQKC